MTRAWWADQVAKISFRMIVFLLLFAAPGGIGGFTPPAPRHADRLSNPGGHARCLSRC